MTMNRLLGAGGALSVALLCSPASAATVVVVDNLGSILNASVSFPGTKTPGSGKAFADYFEFTLPVGEFVSASVSLSGPTIDQIPKNKGHLILANWTSTGPTPPHIPAGAIIEQAIISPPSNGGQSATVGTFTPFGDWEPAGNYFVQVSGISGGGSLKLAVDGNVTAVVPEPATWAMMLLGFAGLGYAGLGRSKSSRLDFAA